MWASNYILEVDYIRKVPESIQGPIFYFRVLQAAIAYSHDIDPHSYDVDPLEEGMAFKEQSLFACKQAVVQLYKDITFSFSWTLHRE